ncbi:C40 family peptidase [Flavobacterium sp.]
MKLSLNLIVFTLLLLFTVNCFSQTKRIITSKEEATKKGVYKSPAYDNTLVYNEPIKSAKSKSAAKSVEKNSYKSKVTLNTKNEKDIIIDDEETDYVTEQLVNNLIDNLGVNYSFGGTTKSGFDCSGLLYTTFKKFDIILPRASSSMADIGEKVNVKNAEKGDLIFFSTLGGKRITHVGLITEVNENEILFVHSSTSAGVIVSSLTEAYYKNAFVQINKIL